MRSSADLSQNWGRKPTSQLFKDQADQSLKNLIGKAITKLKEMSGGRIKRKRKATSLIASLKAVQGGRKKPKKINLENV